MALQWDQLANYDDQGNVQYRLAESITPSADAMTYTVKLRDGITWSDGTPFTADDVLFSWKINANPNQSYNSGLWAEVVGHAEWVAGGDFSADIAGITAPDPQTVEFKLTGPNGAFLSTLLNFRNYILPSKNLLAAAPDIHSLNQKDIWALPYWQQPDVALGPYKWVKTEVDQFIEFDANPNYWQGPPPFEKIQLFQIQDFAVSAAQLASGDLDFAQVTLDDQTGLEGQGFTSGVGVAPFPIQSDFNNTSSYFKDVRVRQAFMYGCDRQGFADTFLKGKSIKIDTYFFPNWVPKEGITEYNFDLAKAKELLDAAAADGAFDYAKPVIWLSWNKDARDRQSFIEDCQSKMSEIGVNIEITNGLEVTNKLGKEGNWDLQLYGGYPIKDPHQLTQPLNCKNIGEEKDPSVLEDYRKELAPEGYAWGGSNYTNWCNEEFDRLMEEAKKLSDQAARADLYKQAQDIFLEEIPLQISYIGANAFSWSPKLEGVVVYGDPSQWAWGIMNWKFTS
jgi:peptide/nickel transport system substrate-binding protein